MPCLMPMEMLPQSRADKAGQRYSEEAVDSFLAFYCPEGRKYFKCKENNYLPRIVLTGFIKGIGG